MIKLTPHAFSLYSAPFYPAFPPTSPATQDNLDPSSPDVSASPEMVNAPSIAQALEAVRHSAGLLASVPPKQRSYHAAVLAALQKVEGEFATTSIQSSLGPPPPGGASGSNGSTGEKRPREENDDDSSSNRSRPPPPPTPSTSFDFSGGVNYSGDLSLSMGESVGESSTPKANGREEGLGGGLEELTDLSIASLVGTQAFWSWQSTLPGDINAGLSSVFA